MTENLMYKILVADDEANVRLTLRELLRREGYEIVEAVDGQDAVEKADDDEISVFILDIKMPRLDGMSALKRIRQKRPDAVCLMLTAYGSPKVGREAIQGGAYDYFNKPFEIEELKIVVRRACERSRLERKIHELEHQLVHSGGLRQLIGGCQAMERLYQIIQRVADSDITVLVTGESGTGKELVAQAIHELSPRRDREFIKINCAAIPEPLLESELFGHEKGSFTGAVQRKPGKFELASGGTLLLDEIGEIPLSLQPKLLRALQEREIQRVGGTDTIHINLRLIAATNRDLGQMVEEKLFREDLFYRLNVIPIKIPPLRERVEDLPALVTHFFKKFKQEFNKQVREIHPDAMQALLNYYWPGNVRELQNVIQRAIVLASGDAVLLEHLPPNVLSAPADLIDMLAPAPEGPVAIDAANGIEAFDFSRPMSEWIEGINAKLEKKMILAALKRTGHKRQETADLLGISRKSLHNKMLKHDLF